MAEEKATTKHHRGRRKKKKPGILSTIILLAAIAVFAYSAFQLFQIFSEYAKGKSEYSKIQGLAIQTPKVTGKDENEAKEEDLSAMKVDFDALKEINTDVVAWIRFQEPAEINYPVVQGSDNEEYLNRTFEANTNKLGTLFVDMDNKGDFSDRNTFIYGHNMKNGTMFARLMDYKDQSFYEANPYFYIYTPDGKASKYQIFSAGVVLDVSDNYIRTYASDEEFLAYLDLAKRSSAYDTGVEVGVESKIISLSTCTNVTDEERFLVQGVKIEEFGN